MSSKPAVLVFDVNETLSDLSPLGARFVEVGASASAAPLWFASLLRDGFALTAAGVNAPFAGVARELLLAQLSQAQLNRSVTDAARHVMDGFASLEMHADVVNGVDRLAEDGYRLVTLSNGATSVAERLLEAAGVRDRFERLLSVEDAPAWKPAASAYTYAAEQCGCRLEDMAMVAVHPWDVDGARRAGMQTVWVNRSDSPFSAVFSEPHHTVAAIDELPDLWQEPTGPPRTDL
jgi:2-haloacid dehalogenase